MIKAYLLVIPLIFSIAYTQSVEIKDGDDNVLMQINDDGASGVAVVASLNVGDNGIQLGSTGSPFIEIQEITGTTVSSGSITTVSLPTGFTGTNSRILSAEIYNGSLNAWECQGGDLAQAPFFVSLDNTVDNLNIYHFASPPYTSTSYRIVLMKMP